MVMVVMVIATLFFVTGNMGKKQFYGAAEATMVTKQYDIGLNDAK